MDLVTLLDEKEFWVALRHLEQLKGPVSLKSICEEIDVSEDIITRAVYFYKILGLDIQLNTIEGAKVVSPPSDSPTIDISFSLSEWLSLQSQLPMMEEFIDDEAHSSFLKKLNDIEGKFQNFDLYGALAELEDYMGIHAQAQELPAEDRFCLSIIEGAILSKSLINVILKDQRKVVIYPHRLVYLEGGLSLVGEDYCDGTISQLSINTILDVEENIFDDYTPNFSRLEVEDFINGIRTIQGNETRLILKVYSQEKVNLSPLYHYLGNPYVITNNNGDLIWAATVEPCEDLFKWLAELGESIEILDPATFKQDFENYRKEKLKKVA